MAWSSWRANRPTTPRSPWPWPSTSPTANPRGARASPSSPAWRATLKWARLPPTAGARHWPGRAAARPTFRSTRPSCAPIRATRPCRPACARSRCASAPPAPVPPPHATHCANAAPTVSRHWRTATSKPPRPNFAACSKPDPTTATRSAAWACCACARKNSPRRAATWSAPRARAHPHAGSRRWTAPPTGR